MEISKKEGNMNRLIAGALTGAVLMTAPLAASALVIDINTYLTGGSGGSNVTVATLTLTQNGNNVDFRFENSIGNLGTIANNAYIAGLLFSYDGSPLLNSGSFLNFAGTQAAPEKIDINPSGKDAGYDFYLDLDYLTSNDNPALRFTDGEYSTWTVSAADGVSAVMVSDFTTLVTANGNGKPASLAMIHIQGVEGAGKDPLKYVGSEAAPLQEDSGTVPEPATLALLGLGMASLAWMRQRKK
jgi:hypothetical protein